MPDDRQRIYIDVYCTQIENLLKENGRERNGLNVTPNKKRARIRSEISSDSHFAYIFLRVLHAESKEAIHPRTSQVFTFMDGCRPDGVAILFSSSVAAIRIFCEQLLCTYPLDVESLLSPESVGRSEESSR